MNELNLMQRKKAAVFNQTGCTWRNRRLQSIFILELSEVKLLHLKPWCWPIKRVEIYPLIMNNWLTCTSSNYTYLEGEILESTSLFAEFGLGLESNFGFLFCLFDGAGDASSRSGCLCCLFLSLDVSGAGEDDLDGWRLLNTLLRTPDLEPDFTLTFCLFSSILFMTASHLLGFLILGVLCLMFSSFSFNIAWKVLYHQKESFE